MKNPSLLLKQDLIDKFFSWQYFGIFKGVRKTQSPTKLNNYSHHLQNLLFHQHSILKYAIFFDIPILAMLANSAIAQCAKVFYEPCVRLLATICRPPPVPLSCIAENCKDFFCKWKAHAICCFGSLSICFGRFPCFEI